LWGTHVYRRESPLYEVPIVVVSFDAKEVLGAAEMSGSSFSSARFDGFSNAQTWIAK